MLLVIKFFILLSDYIYFGCQKYIKFMKVRNINATNRKNVFNCSCFYGGFTSKICIS